MKIKLITLFLMSMVVAACATEPLKAPCNEHATFCGSKTKINQW